MKPQVSWCLVDPDTGHMVARLHVYGNGLRAIENKSHWRTVNTDELRKFLVSNNLIMYGDDLGTMLPTPGNDTPLWVFGVCVGLFAFWYALAKLAIRWWM